MDPLTHTLFGAALARTRLGAAPLAGAALVIGSNLPDIDALVVVAGADASFLCRRGWTHGILGLPLLALALAAILSRLRSDARFTELLRPSLIGVIGHPLLDWLNSYGVRLLTPFDNRWFYGDAVFIVDPWIWLTLGAALVLGRRPSRSGAIGWVLLAIGTTAVVLATRDLTPWIARWAWFGGVLTIAGLAVSGVGRRHGALVARVGLCAVVVYCAALALASAGAERWVRAELTRRGLEATGRIMVGPRATDFSAWDVVAEESGGFRTGTFRVLGAPRLSLDGALLPKPPDTPPVRAARAAPGVRGTLRWMRFESAAVDEDAAGYTVRFIDARYARPGSRGFGSAEVRLDRELRVLSAGPGRRPP